MNYMTDEPAFAVVANVEVDRKPSVRSRRGLHPLRKLGPEYLPLDTNETVFEGLDFVVLCFWSADRHCGGTVGQGELVGVGRQNTIKSASWALWRVRNVSPACSGWRRHNRDISKAAFRPRCGSEQSQMLSDQNTRRRASRFKTERTTPCVTPEFQ